MKQRFRDSPWEVPIEGAWCVHKRSMGVENGIVIPILEKKLHS